MTNLLQIVNKYLVSFIVIITLLLFTSDPVLAVSQDNGAAIFETNCAGCHPKGGNIIRRGKNLRKRALKRNHLETIEAIASLVTNGKNNMPAYEERLSNQEIEAVSSYVLEQAAKNWRN
ncbi:MAG: c-type cytochrome [Xenococcaceae cyanobacterium MO_207.B15]|nr:c-type cytochrome [Xenococcaceae cyanobacterium MO_207.B15]